MSETAEFQTPSFALISTASTGDQQVVAAVTGKKIRVLSYTIVSTSANAVKFRSASTDKTGAMALAANGGVSTSYSPVGHFETVAGEALNINLGSAAQISGHLTYCLVR